jgi:hypothetical protein
MMVARKKGCGCVLCQVPCGFVRAAKPARL